METFHQQLARIAFDAGDELGLVLAGGYAVSAHQLTDRPSRDLDFATAAPMNLPDVAARLSAAYQRAGYRIVQVESTSRMARLEVSDGRRDLLKEAIGPPVQLEIGPVLTLDDAVGLKMRALHDRAAHRDFIDVYAAATRGGYTPADLERLAACTLRILPRRTSPTGSRPSSCATRVRSTATALSRTIRLPS